MPIEGISQPRYIEIKSELRLRAYDGRCDFAFDWYQDVESLELIDGPGNAVPYTFERLKAMYDYLDHRGELYFIEKKQDDVFVPIGDVTFSPDDMPIVISREFRYQGIGGLVIRCLIERARNLCFKAIRVGEIYSFNIASQRLFERNGFVKEESTVNGATYLLALK